MKRTDTDPARAAAPAVDLCRDLFRTVELHRKAYPGITRRQVRAAFRFVCAQLPAWKERLA